MKYFEHYTTDRNTVEAKKIKKVFGAEGYGVYITLLEVIGEHVKGNNIEDWGHVSPLHDLESLADECSVTIERLKEILAFCDEKHIFERHDGRLYSSLILERLDAYANKVRQSLTKSDNVAINRIEENRKEQKRKDVEEKEIEKEKQFTPSASEVKPSRARQAFFAKVQEIRGLSKRDEAILEETQPKGLTAKGIAVEALKLALVVATFLTFSFSPIEAKTVRIQYKLKLTRPNYQLSGTALPKASKKVPEQKNTAGERPVVARTDIENKILEKFGEDGEIALAVARCESGLRPGAIGDGHLTYTKDGVEYGKSYGLFQIRHLEGRPSPEQLLDADYNIEYAYNLYMRSGFGPWSAYTNLCYKNFL